MFQKFILYFKQLSYKRYLRNIAKSHFSKTTFDEIFLYDIYKLKKIIKKINLSSDNFKILDIGAHHGFYSFYLKEIINEIGNIKFAKIDCEGAEDESVPEAIVEISNNIENLFIEIHHSHKERNIFYNLLNFKYPTVIDLSDSMKMAFFSKNILHIE